MRHGDRLVIRSFRVVFELERRIHKVDRWRIPIPYGVPLRGLAYWALALVVVIALTRMPLAAAVMSALPTPVRLVVLPVGIAYTCSRIEVDGRPGHAALVAWARWKLLPARTAALRRVATAGTVVRLGDVTFVPDERAARYRRAVVDGPAQVLLRYPARKSVKGMGRPVLHVSQLAGGPLFVGKHVRLRAGQRMVLHP